MQVVPIGPKSQALVGSTLTFSSRVLRSEKPTPGAEALDSAVFASARSVSGSTVGIRDKSEAKSGGTNEGMSPLLSVALLRQGLTCIQYLGRVI